MEVENARDRAGRPMTVKATRREPLEEVSPIRRTSLSDKIIEQIIDLISRNVLQPGERLPSEKDLCKRFGVGRASLREALRSLAVMGILDGRVGEGTFVSHNNQRYLERNLQWGLLLDRKKVEDLLETRLMLESQTSFSAARKATEANLEAMEATIEGMENSVDRPEQYLRFDLDFHLLVAQATQNTILCNLLSMTRGYLQAWIKESLDSSPSGPKDRHRAESSIREHRAILQALRKGQAEQAREAMTAHILSSSADLHQHIEQKSGP
jgi:GntR family transcriptional repressor for pyruvate dehydrogenase complex